LSSILRALKKLDEEAVPREKEPGNPIKNIRQVVNRKTGITRFFSPAALFLFALVVLAVALWVFFQSGKTNSTKKNPPSAIQTGSSTNHPNEGSKVAQSIPVSRELNEQQGKEKEIKAGSSASIPSMSSDIPVPLPLPRASEITTNTPVPGITNPPESQEQPKTSPEKPKHPNLTLNGILWSDNIERRVVMLNDSYLKEGDVIQGVTVVSITENSVVLKYGQEKLALKLNK